MTELPADEGVKVLVVVGGDEGTSPIDGDTELLEVLDTVGREVLQPVDGVLRMTGSRSTCLELGNLLVGDVHLLQDVVDGGLGTAGLGDELGLLSVELTGNLRHGLRGNGSGSGLLLLFLFYR